MEQHLADCCIDNIRFKKESKTRLSRTVVTFDKSIAQILTKPRAPEGVASTLERREELAGFEKVDCLQGRSSMTRLE